MTDKYDVTIAGDSALYGELAQTLVESGCVVENRTADPDSGTVSVQTTDDGIVVLGDKATVEAGIATFRDRSSGIQVDIHPH